MLNLLTVVGARPQFIKAAALSRALGAHQNAIREQIVHTGQHFSHEMSEVFFTELEIPLPYKNLAVPGGPHGLTTGRMLEALEGEMLTLKPDMVLVYGDTNSTLAGALAASKLGIPIAHVEAGMRSFNRAMPEEINRVLTDHISDLLFCTSQSACDLLAAEGITRGVAAVGDVMFDAVLHYCEEPYASRPLDAPYALLTMHRAENVDNKSRISAIIRALGRIALPIYFPIHPRTAARIEEFDLGLPDNVVAVPPLSYRQLLEAAAQAEFVITDSGGLQKEAYYLSRKCICLREETEWTELVSLGANRLVGTDSKSIEDAVSWATHPSNFAEQPYGDGTASEQIAKALACWAEAKHI